MNMGIQGKVDTVTASTAGLGFASLLRMRSCKKGLASCSMVCDASNFRRSCPASLVPSSRSRPKSVSRYERFGLGKDSLYNLWCRSETAIPVDGGLLWGHF